MSDAQTTCHCGVVRISVKVKKIVSADFIVLDILQEELTEPAAVQLRMELAGRFR